MQSLISLIYQAGTIARSYLGQDTAYQVKPDQSLVTEADLAVEEFLITHLREAFPTYGILSEENWPDVDPARYNNIWVIDPIDGTTAFQQGLPGWGIAIGLLQHGRPQHGLYYMPLTDDLTYTHGDVGVSQGNGRDLQGAVRQQPDLKDFLATTASAHRRFDLTHFRLRALGSVGANLVYTARGVAAAAFLPRPRLWDLVAGAAILRRAGGTLRYLSGQPLDYLGLLNGQPTSGPVVAGRDPLLAQIQYQIHPRQEEFAD